MVISRFPVLIDHLIQASLLLFKKKNTATDPDIRTPEGFCAKYCHFLFEVALSLKYDFVSLICSALFCTVTKLMTGFQLPWIQLIWRSENTGKGLLY